MGVRTLKNSEGPEVNGDGCADWVLKISLPLRAAPWARGGHNKMISCWRERRRSVRVSPVALVEPLCGAGRRRVSCYAWCRSDKRGERAFGRTGCDIGQLSELARHDVDANEKYRVCQVRYLRQHVQGVGWDEEYRWAGSTARRERRRSGIGGLLK